MQRSEIARASDLFFFYVACMAGSKRVGASWDQISMLNNFQHAKRMWVPTSYF